CLHPVRASVHPPRDVEHGEDREERGDEQIEHGPVDAEHAEMHPVGQLELVLGLELVVLVGGDAEDDREHDDTTDPDAKARVHDLSRVAHRDLGRVSGEMPSCTVNAKTMTTRVVRPSFLPNALRASTTVKASANRRPSM